MTAIGGMGKSALAWKFFHDVAPAARGVAGRLWWSFYDQDSGFDTFVLRALAYVTERPLAEIRSLPAAERVDRLLEALDARPFLVVLDGVERLLLAYSRVDAARVRDDEVEEAATQAVDEVRGARAGTGSFAGNDRLRTATDPRVGAFLRRLPGLATSRVLVTSRLFPRELQRRDGRAVPGSGMYRLEGLDDADALALWREAGCGGDDAELTALFRIDPREPIDEARLVTAARRTAHTVDQVRSDYERLAPDLDLVLTWR
jgi:hypothetical protein